MSVFRPGDRVRTIAPSWGTDLVPVGSVGTVRPSKVHGVIPVAFDHHRVGDGSGAWSMFARQLQHIHRAPIRFLRWPFAVLVPRIARAFTRTHRALTARRKDKAYWLCPAPKARSRRGEPCLRRLPCARHDVPNAITGHILHGSSYLCRARNITSTMGVPDA